MKTIKEEKESEIIINKSKFISIITKVETIDEVKDKLKEIKKKYKGATHYCYAYIINGYQKCSDDKEPSGTAGIPILNILKTNELNYILCVVVRYFGGIKLGAGGLVRAYSSSTKEVIGKCEFGNLTPGYNIIIDFEYENIKQIENILKDIQIIKAYDTKVIYEFDIEKEEYNKIKEKLDKYSTLRKIEEITIVKKAN
ncbi:MAG: YigZ family protein [Bacilli bacterium]|nr:YigZ family protein [Bacilli bacterium]